MVETIVYRVIDLGDGPQIAKRTAKVGPKTVSVSFPSLLTHRWNANALGTMFFLTEADAVRDFAIKQRRNLESAERMRADAEEALAWAGAKAFELASADKKEE